jgi:RHS repeat-associated protein
MLMLRSLGGSLELTAEQRAAADVAPFADGSVVGDGRVDAADAQLLLRAATGTDIDQDGLSNAEEALAGTWPLARDTDGDGTPDGAEDADEDGVSNAAERNLGTAIDDPDTDGDGWVDGEDPLPLLAAGLVVAYIHVDHLGSVRVVTDAAGNVVRRIHYGLFGETRSNVRAPGAPVTAPDPEHGYTGQRRDPATGLLYYGARWYDAANARFLSPDTIAVDGADPPSQDRYAYGRYDPLRRVDPTGHWPAWASNLFGGGGDDDFELSYWDTPDWDPLGRSDFGDWDWGGDAGWWGFSYESTDYAVFDTFGASAWQWSFGDSGYAGDVRPSWFESIRSRTLLRADPADMSWRTERNRSFMRRLHPVVAGLAARHLSLMTEAGLHVRLTHGFRTYGDQDAEYAKGRNGDPRDVVTYARGGQSLHNFGLAYDIALFDDDGRYIIDGSDPRYLQAGDLGRAIGLEWGGAWTRPYDPSHFQFNGGRSTPTIRKWWETGMEILP